MAWNCWYFEKECCFFLAWFLPLAIVVKGLIFGSFANTLDSQLLILPFSSSLLLVC